MQKDKTKKFQGKESEFYSSNEETAWYKSA